MCVIVWRVGDAADCFRDPHPGASSSADVQHSTAPQGPGGSSLPARLPGASGETFTFSRRFYPKRLTIGQYIKRLILKRQTDRGSARNTKSQALFK